VGWWLAALAVLWGAIAPGVAAAAPAGRWLEVPHRSQLDGSPYQGSNCGPAALGMVLAYYGRSVSTRALRGEVNDLQGTWGDFSSGTAVRSLVLIAARHGLRPLGAFDGVGLRRWTLDDVRGQLDAGHPVIAEVWYRGLPGRADSTYNGDHYIVLVGYSDDELIYNDPVDRSGGRRISWRAFERAWRNGDLALAALAVADEEAEAAAAQAEAAAAAEAAPVVDMGGAAAAAQQQMLGIRRS
jgi:ABC-type bacteriocin/lantibiotic exporter with double-glycine peptidase domain